ncbi:hypothetical protein X777_10669 [Ooceraea biroi]|uniref:Uncharacterized protein n=1 Tax=Ooceraea biroi TaxID=2015173 RepID=A0A026W4F1_OOCBI|nr:hypothetical protein X777_10669 [Ooceraea biroi]
MTGGSRGTPPGRGFREVTSVARGEVTWKGGGTDHPRREPISFVRARR